jgi:hypothetical protein
MECQYVSELVVGCYGSAYSAPSVKTMCCCCSVLMAFQSTVGTKKVAMYRIYWITPNVGNLI